MTTQLQSLKRPYGSETARICSMSNAYLRVSTCPSLGHSAFQLYQNRSRPIWPRLTANQLVDNIDKPPSSSQWIAGRGRYREPCHDRPGQHGRRMTIKDLIQVRGAVRIGTMITNISILYQEWLRATCADFTVYPAHSFCHGHGCTCWVSFIYTEIFR